MKRLRDSFFLVFETPVKLMAAWVPLSIGIAQADSSYDIFDKDPNLVTEWTEYGYFLGENATPAWSRVDEDLVLSKPGGNNGLGLYRTGSSRNATDPVSMTVKELSRTGGTWGMLGLMISTVPQPGLTATDDDTYTLRMEKTGPTTFKFLVLRTYLDGTGNYVLYDGPSQTFSGPYKLDIERVGVDYVFKVNGATLYTTGTAPGDFYDTAVKDSMKSYQIVLAGDGAMTATVDDFGVSARIAENYPLEGKIGVVRTWTTRSGTRVAAKLISAKGNRVTLHTTQRKTVAIAFNKLSVEDRRYLVQPLPERKRDVVMIKPIAIVEDSGSYAKSSSTARLIDAGGLQPDLKTGDPVPGSFPTFTGTYRDMWMSKEGAIRDQYVVFDLGALYEVATLYVWPFAMSGRETVSVKQMAVYGSDKNDLKGLQGKIDSWTPVNAEEEKSSFFVPLGKHPQPSAQILTFAKPVTARFILFDIHMQHAEHGGFVGLSKVRFAGRPVAGDP